MTLNLLMVLVVNSATFTVKQAFMDEDLKYWYLRDHKLFRTLSFKQMKQLCIIMGFKEAKKKRRLFIFIF
jgi:hypothetical protein